MKKQIGRVTNLALITMLGLCLLSGCGSSEESDTETTVAGVSQEEYDALLSENKELKEQLAQYESQSNTVYEEETEAIDEIDISGNDVTTPSSESDFIYVNNGTEVQINGYQGNGGYVVIPSEIEGNTVTRIAPNAFEEAKNITGISLPENLEYIGDNAFYGLSELTGVLVLPKTMCEVEDHAFQSTGLTGLVIQSDCKIGLNAFANIYSLEFVYVVNDCAPQIAKSVFTYAEDLTTIILPDSISEIKDDTFKYCNKATVYTITGSYAEEYANRNFINVDTDSYDEQVAEFERLYLSETEGETETAVTDTETYYNLCMNLTKNDCTKSSLGTYGYNGITFMPDDSDWLDSPLNSDGSIHPRSFYMKLQSCLANFSIGNSWDSYAEHIIGYTPSSRDEFAPFVDECLTYMTDSLVGNSMMEKFQTLDSVDVLQDGSSYTCTIANVSECAKELNISEEMLGYIMGALHDCGATITFDGSECVIEYTDYFSE